MLNHRLQYNQQGNHDCEGSESVLETVASGDYFTPCKGKLLPELLTVEPASKERIMAGSAATLFRCLFNGCVAVALCF